MRTLVIYISQTGFTRKYAEWLSKRMDADILTIQEAKKKSMEYFGEYDAIVYGGWAMAGSVVDSKWFLQKSAEWKDKRMAIFCVGASPEENPDVEESLNRLLTDEQKTYMKAFYCQGGIDYSRMKTPSKLAMKALVSVLKNKKDASEKEKDMANMIDHSYDISDEKYLDPIVRYLLGAN